MPDVKPAGPGPGASPLYLRDEELKQGVDLLFLAARDMWAQGEQCLRDARLGRAHWRVLYFVARNPGLTVTDLLSVLKITKQSLNRVLNDLLGANYLERKAAMRDRRMRVLKLTAKGAELEAALWGAQRPALVRAFRAAGPEAVVGFQRVLMGLVGEGRVTTKAGPP